MATKKKHSKTRRAPEDTLFNTRPVLNSRGNSQFWLVPEIPCVFLPNQRSVGREVLSCLLTRISIDRHTRLVRLARFCSRRKVSITAQNVRETVRNIGGEIRWTFRRYRYSSVFPSVRICLNSPKIAVINFDVTIIFILPTFPSRGISRIFASIAVAETLLISRANVCF